MTKEESLMESNPNIRIPYCCTGELRLTGSCNSCVWFAPSRFQFGNPGDCLRRPISNPYSVMCSSKDCEHCDVTFCFWYGRKFPKTDSEIQEAYEYHKQRPWDGQFDD